MGTCVYDNIYELQFEKWEHNDMPALLSISENEMNSYKKRLNEKIQLMLIELERRGDSELSDELFYPKLGEIYYYTMILLTLMYKCKKKMKWSPELNAWLHTMEKIQEYEMLYSSKNRYEDIKKLLIKAVL